MRVGSNSIVVEALKACQLLSIIVPVFDDAAGLHRCLVAMDRQTLSKNRFEVIVVDNGSRSALNRVVAPFRFARLVMESKPGSYAARNAGVALAKGDIFVFTDADCEPSTDWLEQVVRVFDSQPELGALGGRINLRISGLRTTAELYELVLSPFPQQEFVQQMNFAATANLAVRAHVFRAVGRFNERLLSSGDREWGNRLVAGGYTLRYAAEPSVVHPARTSIRALVNKRLRIAGGTVGLAAVREGFGGEWHSGRLHPPRRELAARLLLAPETLGLSRNEGAKVLALAACLVLIRVLEGFRLQLGGQPLR